MGELKLDTERRDGWLRLRPRGELDMHVAPRLRQILHSELAEPPARVIVDMEDVPFIDSSILATLVEGLKIVRSKGAKLTVENCQPAVRDTFEIAGLLGSFGIA